jgi:hypothetical protein
MIIDWQQLALNLRVSGSLTALSEKEGWNKQYINEIARAEIKEPRFSVGVRLLDLHLDICGIEKHKRLCL